MRIVDILMAFPGILLNIAIVATVAQPGPRRHDRARCARTAGSATPASRAARCSRCASATTSPRRSRSARRTARVMLRHLIPNLLGPALVQMSFGFGSVILVEAALSFLGLGPQVDYTWGAMLDQARDVPVEDATG